MPAYPLPKAPADRSSPTTVPTGDPWRSTRVSYVLIHFLERPPPRLWCDPDREETDHEDQGDCQPSPWVGSQLAHEETGDQGADPGHDPGEVEADPLTGGTNLGGEQLGQEDGEHTEATEDEEPGHRREDQEPRDVVHRGEDNDGDEERAQAEDEVGAPPADGGLGQPDQHQVPEGRSRVEQEAEVAAEVHDLDRAPSHRELGDPR